MTPDEALEVADEVLFAHTGKHLTDLQRMILQASWADKSYMDMLGQGWELPTIRKAGNKLWNLLSEALGEEVSKTSFRGALEKRLKAGGMMPKPPMPSSYNQQNWVGRESLITDLLPKLQGQTRLLWITGISGIGKTALGECVASKAWESDPAFQWIYLEVLEGQSPDFPSVAADLLAKLGDRDLDPQERNNPDQLAKRLLQKLQSHFYWIQLDALERLLNPEHPTELVDPYWVTFLQRCLTNSTFASRLVLTSQAFPNALIELNDRYPNVWTEIQLDGLLQVEQQLEFFAKRGISVDSANRDILARIAKIYEGHPLVLKVIAEGILKEFAGDVDRYWQVYQPEFEQVARELQAARLDETDYNEALYRKVRERIKKSLEQLPTDALDLLCRSAVFRRPVPKKFWLAMIADCSPKQQREAYRVLGDRALIEQEGIHQNQHLIRQHNLIRDIAYDLLRGDVFIWETTERQAAELWLTIYQPAPGVPNLEEVRGQIEALYHFCEIADWDKAEEIYAFQIASMNQELYRQLFIWGQYRELIQVSSQLLKGAASQTKARCLLNLGNSYSCLGNQNKAIEYYQETLNFTREIGNRRGESRALGNLGLAYHNLGNYQQAIEFLQQRLAIAREIGDRQGEAIALGNIGDTYHALGNYSEVVELQNQKLTIAREMGDRASESYALSGLGEAFIKLEQCVEALETFQSALTICRDIEQRSVEAVVLKNLAILHQKTGSIDEAKQYCDRALALAIELGIPLQEEC